MNAKVIQVYKDWKLLVICTTHTRRTLAFKGSYFLSELLHGKN